MKIINPAFKMKDKKYIAVLLFAIIISNDCLSQDTRSKIKVKLDSLYPKARIIGWYGSKAKTEDVLMYCNCPEFGGEMQLTFDTNANILIKEYYYGSLNDLPDTILSYIKNNTSKTVRFDPGYFEKYINYKGEVSYCIRMNENSTWYDIKLKSTGEIISKTKEPQFRE